MTPLVYADLGELARAAAAELIGRLAAAQMARGSASIVLTGGRSAAAIHAAVLADPTRQSVDWSRVDVWWSDERFLPAGHPDRNETQARTQWLDVLAFDPARVHPMPAADGPDGADPDAAAARYAATLRPLPAWDLLLLGVGEDGHVASLFPGQPVGPGTTHDALSTAESADMTVAAVRDSPKPPPVRLTLTLPTINTAAHVWLIATGAAKADAVGRALGGRALDGNAPVPPAAGVRGAEETRWLLDRAAARDVPAS